MKYFYFQSRSQPALHAFTDTGNGEKIPSDDGPWRLVRAIDTANPWHHAASQDVVRAGVAENGFYLWESSDRASLSPIIESDRVEGTSVLDPAGKEIGVIKRLLIEKVSGRVVYVDVIFGGFLGLGEKHQTIPWTKLRYDPDLSAYTTDITEKQLRSAPGLYDGEEWPDRQREAQFHEYWSAVVYWRN